MKEKPIEEIYNALYEKINKYVDSDKEIQAIHKQLYILDKELHSTISPEEYKIFDEYLICNSLLKDIEFKKVFSYGYNLSNRLIIDALRER